MEAGNLSTHHPSISYSYDNGNSVNFPLVEFQTAPLLTRVTPTSVKTLRGTLYARKKNWEKFRAQERTTWINNEVREEKLSSSFSCFIIGTRK